MFRPTSQMIFILPACVGHNTGNMSAILAVLPLTLFGGFWSLWPVGRILDLSPHTTARAPQVPVGHSVLSPPDG